MCHSARVRPGAEDGSKVLSGINTERDHQIPPSLSIENLQLEDTGNRRGRTTEKPLAITMTTPTPPPLVVDDSDVVLYRLWNKEDRACILILTDAIIRFNYVTRLNEAREVDMFTPPRIFDAAGTCANGDDASFTITWKNFAWAIYVSKVKSNTIGMHFLYFQTPGGDLWYIEKMTLDANTVDKHLEHVNRTDAVLHFASADRGGMLFPTPIGKSFACDEELSMVLTDGAITATVLLRKLRMQPFIFKSEFGPEHTCSTGGAKSYRDVTAPVAVGSTLAVVSILLNAR